MWESSPFSARLILWSAFGDAALTRPGRTISLGEGNMHTRVHLCDPRLPRLVLSKVSSRLPLRVRWGWQFAAA